MIEILIAIVIALILLILYKLSIAMGFMIFYGFILYNKKFIFGGDWECDAARPYGDRCEEKLNAIYKDKMECETFCLTSQELKPSIENIIKFTYDRGMVFPVPKAFLLRVADGDLQHEYYKFKRRNMQNVITDALFSSAGLFDQILKNELGDRLMTKHLPYSMLSKNHPRAKLINDVLKTSRKGEALLRKWADRLNQSAKQFYVFGLMDLLGDEQMRTDILEKRSGVAVLNISLVTSQEDDEMHINIFIVSYDSKKIFHFEPYLGTATDWVIPAIAEYLEPLNFTFESSKNCPESFQTITDDHLCVTYSLFAALLFALNPSTHYRELLDYFIGLQKKILKVINVMTFYIYKFYSDHAMEIADAIFMKAGLNEQIYVIDSINKDVIDSYLAETNQETKEFLYILFKTNVSIVNKIQNIDASKLRSFHDHKSLNKYIEYLTKLLESVQNNPHSIDKLKAYFEKNLHTFFNAEYKKEIKSDLNQPGCVIL
jgi:hypothetical protein